MFKSKNRYRESHVYGAFAVGALAGAAVALLFAPSAGRETRDAIAERVHDVSQRIRTARRRMMQRMNAGAGTGDLPAGVWPGTPSQAETGADYESERGNGGEQS
jgi:gas vesicle protein